MSLIRLVRPVLLFLASGSLLMTGARIATAAEAGWAEVEVPDVWESRSDDRYLRNRDYTWFRCQVVIPENWRALPLQLFVEPVDDARELFWNGKQIGMIGAFPPAYRSGLNDRERFDIEPGSVRYGGLNTLAIRIYRNDSRQGFSVAAPAVFGGEEAIHLKGKWQAMAGDGYRPEPDDDPQTPAFSEVQPAADVERVLKHLENGRGALAPLESLAKLEAPEDLAVDLALSDPAIGQPLSIKFDARGRLWLVEYLQYPNPAGLKMVSRDAYLRTVYDRMPPAPPNHFPGRDRVTIHEDTDGDGRFDAHKIFVEGLNMVSSIALGRGGVWVLNPPYLLFYRDENGDDRPDGAPEVHLEGFGLEDTHSIVNSLRWGPDGWLYAAQGSTVTGHVRIPGRSSPGNGGEKNVVKSLGQLIWRYHPGQRRYEVFAEGGGNAFGVEIDSEGRIFSGHNGGNTRGFHYVQGGYSQKGFGKHGELSNPYAFGYFNAMAHHDVPRFTHTFVIYDGGALPVEYHNDLFGVEPLQGRVVRSKIERAGSTYKTSDIEHVLVSGDPWFRPVDIQTGPDGALYIADFYEQRIDHASHYQGRVHRESGRIYRVRAREAEPGSEPFDLAELTSTELAGLLAHSNKWFRQTALRLIGDRAPAELIPLLKARIDEKTAGSLESLWALHLCGGLGEPESLEFLDHSLANVREWTVRLLGDKGRVSAEVAGKLAELARYEDDVQVRSQLASSARRLPASQAIPIIDQLIQRGEDAADPHVPLLIWWAIESKLNSDRDAVLAMVARDEVWNAPLFREHLASRLMRRFAAAGAWQDLEDCVTLLNRARTKNERKELLAGLEAAFRGRPLTGLPEPLSLALAEASETSLPLAVRAGDQDAIVSAIRLVQDENADVLERGALIDVLGQVRAPDAVPVLLELVAQSRDDSIRRTAVAALSGYKDASIGETLANRYTDFPPPVRQAVEVLLSSRVTWANAFLGQVEQERIAPDRVAPAVVSKLVNFADPGIRKRAKELWPETAAGERTDADREVTRLETMLAVGSGNPYQGRELYASLCGTCHTLFGKGGQIGPDLTSYQRSDALALLRQVIDPNAEIREGYEQYMVTTADGRVLNGFLADQDSRLVILRGLDGHNTVVLRDQIESMRVSQVSLMPEGLLAPLDAQGIRDLMAYLRSSQPLP